MRRSDQADREEHSKNGLERRKCLRLEFKIAVHFCHVLPIKQKSTTAMCQFLSAGLPLNVLVRDAFQVAPFPEKKPPPTWKTLLCDCCGDNSICAEMPERRAHFALGHQHPYSFKERKRHRPDHACGFASLFIAIDDPQLPFEANRLAQNFCLDRIQRAILCWNRK